MSRTFRATPFRTSYQTADQLGLMQMAAERATHGEDVIARSRKLNGYDRRGVSYLSEPWGFPWGFNDNGDLEVRPRMKRHVKRQTARIVRRLGTILLRAETTEALSPA